MERSMRDESSRGTKKRLLDAAQQLYTEAGPAGLSLRELTDRAGVNLAAVNYHFGSKNALLCAMVARRLDPLNDVRLHELTRLENMLQEKLVCEQIFAALTKSMIRPDFDIIESSADRDFAIRISADFSEPLRQFLARRYVQVQERYLAAFRRATPWLSDDEVGWRIHCLAFALPGIAINTNTLLSLCKASTARGLTKRQALAALSGTIGAVLGVSAPQSELLAKIDFVLTAQEPMAA